MTQSGSVPLLRRVQQTFLAPDELFRRFRFGPAPWFGALGLITAVGVVIALALPDELLLRQIQDRLAGAQAASPTADQMQQVVGFARIGMVVDALLGPAMKVLGLAIVLAAVFNWGLGGSGKFDQYVAVLSHAALILCAGMLLRLPLQVWSGALEVRFSLTLIPESHGLAMPAWAAVATDVFSLWTLAVLVIGIREVNPTISWPTALAVLLVIHTAAAVIL